MGLQASVWLNREGAEEAEKIGLRYHLEQTLCELCTAIVYVTCAKFPVARLIVSIQERSHRILKLWGGIKQKR
jgi:hypothetical protein